MFELFTKIRTQKNYYIFCLWIWILTPLYFLNIQPFSMLYSSFFALLFTIYYSLIYKKNNNSPEFKFFIIVLELGILLTNVYKHFYIDKKPFLSCRDMIFNLVLFMIYLVILWWIGTTFYQLYFIDLLNQSK